MSVAFATRRLWVRRSRRSFMMLTRFLGVVAYVLPPVWLFWFYRAWFRTWKTPGSDGFIGGVILHIVAAVIGGVVSWNMHLGRDATVEELREARAADTCFDDTIVRRAAAWNRPVTISDLRQTQEDCRKMWDDIARKKAQEAALKKQLEK